MVKICTNCSSRMADDSNYCPRCSAPNMNTSNCLQCGATNSPTSIFCNSCGKPLPPMVQPIPNYSTNQDFTFTSPTQRGFQPKEITVAIVGIFLLIGISTYSFYLKTELAETTQQSNQLRLDLERKNADIADKSGTISQLQIKTDGLTGDNEALKEKLDGKIKEVNGRIAEVKKLQTSIKTVSTCLLGVVGGIKALQQDDESLARQSLFNIQSTCQDAGNIVKKFETYPTNQTY